MRDTWINYYQALSHVHPTLPEMFILCTCAADAVPLTVLLTSGRSEEFYSVVFNLLKANSS